jgi:hypothetical protein
MQNNKIVYLSVRKLILTLFIFLVFLELILLFKFFFRFVLNSARASFSRFARIKKLKNGIQKLSVTIWAKK